MTIFTLPVSDPLSASDNRIIPKDKDCIDFWKKTLKVGHASELYEKFQQTAQDLLFRATIQTVSDIDIVAFVRFLCYVDAITVELVEKPSSSMKSEQAQKSEDAEEETSENKEGTSENEGEKESNIVTGSCSEKSTDVIAKNNNDNDDNDQDNDNDDNDQGNDNDGDYNPSDEEDNNEKDKEEFDSLSDKHTASKQFSCKGCEETFTSPWEYDMHLYTKHTPEPKPIAKERKNKKQKNKTLQRKERKKSPEVGIIKSDGKFKSKRLLEKHCLNKSCSEQLYNVSNACAKRVADLTVSSNEELIGTSDKNEEVTKDTCNATGFVENDNKTSGTIGCATEFVRNSKYNEDVTIIAGDTEDNEDATVDSTDLNSESNKYFTNTTDIATENAGDFNSTVFNSDSNKDITIDNKDSTVDSTDLTSDNNKEVTITTGISTENAGDTGDNKSSIAYATELTSNNNKGATITHATVVEGDTSTILSIAEKSSVSEVTDKRAPKKRGRPKATSGLRNTDGTVVQKDNSTESTIAEDTADSELCVPTKRGRSKSTFGLRKKQKVDIDISEANEINNVTESTRRRGRPCGSIGIKRNKTYSCQICSEQIVVSDIKIHMEKEHQVNSEMPCSTCNRVFYNLEMFLEHVERHRIHNQKQYLCSICGKELKNCYTLKEHENTHSKPEKCSLCQKSFSTVGRLKNHMAIEHTKETRFECKHCSKKFYHLHKCKLHEASHEERTYKCSKCDLAFHFQHGLDSHMVTHDPNRELLHCDICKKFFKSKSNLEAHIKQVHEKKKIHPCSICGKKFAKTCTRKQHEATHSDEKPFQCQICGKRFREKGFKRHLEWHKGERKHICDICGKLFAFKENMLKHRRIHTGEKPYSCELCSQAFSYVGQLKKHKQISHKGNDGSDKESGISLVTYSDQALASTSLAETVKAVLSLDIESTIDVL
ncbi:uncharacterized protein [Antedon mediterranea]|uniref:uncharacterized protein isoform X1 n=1 Tax=Antedon mediterranea TaxID=105859 RepID=UPI003AF4F428